jgi:hypothetical protein
VLLLLLLEVLHLLLVLEQELALLLCVLLLEHAHHGLEVGVAHRRRWRLADAQQRCIQDAARLLFSFGANVCCAVLWCAVLWCDVLTDAPACNAMHFFALIVLSSTVQAAASMASKDGACARLRLLRSYLSL